MIYDLAAFIAVIAIIIYVVIAILVVKSKNKEYFTMFLIFNYILFCIILAILCSIIYYLING